MMARRGRGRAFQPRVPQDIPVADTAPYDPEEEMGPPQIPGYVNPAAGYGAHYAQQAAGAFSALSLLQQHQGVLEAQSDCPDAVIEAMQTLEESLSDMIRNTGQLIGELNAWAGGEDE